MVINFINCENQDVAKGAGKEVVLGDQRIEELFEQIGVAWKEVPQTFITGRYRVVCPI